MASTTNQKKNMKRRVMVASATKEKTQKGGDGSRCELKEEHEEEGNGNKHKPKL
jgi:hypothetical protein